MAVISCHESKMCKSNPKQWWIPLIKGRKFNVYINYKQIALWSAHKYSNVTNDVRICKVWSSVPTQCKGLLLVKQDWIQHVWLHLTLPATQIATVRWLSKELVNQNHQPVTHASGCGWWNAKNNETISTTCLAAFNTTRKIYTWKKVNKSLVGGAASWLPTTPQS